MKTVLFTCYGSGHVRAVLPVARALHRSGRAVVRVLALTTAAPEVRAAGLPLVQFKDFVQPGDEPALAQGRALMAPLGAVADPEETIAYLGLSYADLEAEVGADEARVRYARLGRQAFLPQRMLGRILRRVRPDLVVGTNAPRAERAAIEAARAAGVPAICLVDLFAVDEIRWIGRPGYADIVCVLNDQVRDFVVAAGRAPEEVVVTGNPAFDALQGAAAEGARLREQSGWGKARVLLWPAQVEPAYHPFSGVAGDVTLPDRVLQRIIAWTLAQHDAVLCVRARPGQDAMALPSHPRLVRTGQDWPLAPLLHAVDMVVTLTSTVGLEGHLAGTRVVQVLGSMFDASMPLARFGIADAAVCLDDLDRALDAWARAGRRHTASDCGKATERVLAVVETFL